MNGITKEYYSSVRYACRQLRDFVNQLDETVLGVKHEYIRRIEELFQDITVIRLDTNYRSPQAIIDYANSILEKSMIMNIPTL